jgi:SNF2 family DNA or RNA helicase
MSLMQAELKKSDLYPYQKEAVDHILSKNGSMLWLDIGLGKTPITLTAIERLLDQFKISGALVLAPKKVVEAVWEQESQKWEHTQRLRFSAILGTPKQRMNALKTPADVYLINYEQIGWLIGKYVNKSYNTRRGLRKTYSVFSKGVMFTHWLDLGKRLPFDMVVYDEISKLKNSTGKRFKAFTKVLPLFNYRVGLTGTPSANGLIDLHGQFLMVDGGHRLGPNITGFRTRWFMQNAYNMKWIPRRGAMNSITEQIADITLEMKASDYLQLPPLINQDIHIDLPKELKDQYRAFETEFFLELDSGGEVEAFNAGAKSMKCRQLANGAVYVGEAGGPWEEFHSAKLDAVSDIVEELDGKPLLICYQFIHDKERLMARFPDAVALDRKDTAGKVLAWNDGKIRILIGHPGSMGHGLNLQFGGNHVLWFGLPWSLELYMQAIGRLLRNGQKGQAVINHRIITDGTIEMAVLIALSYKNANQDDLRAAVKQYRIDRESTTGWTQ